MTLCIVPIHSSSASSFLFYKDRSGEWQLPTQSRSIMTQSPAEGSVMNLTINGVEHTKICYPMTIPAATAKTYHQSLGHGARSLPITHYTIETPWSSIQYHVGFTFEVIDGDWYVETIPSSTGIIEYSYRWNDSSQSYKRDGSYIEYQYQLDKVKPGTNGPDGTYITARVIKHEAGKTEDRITTEKIRYNWFETDITSTLLPTEISEELASACRSGITGSATGSILNLVNRNVEQLIKSLDANKTNNLEGLSDLLDLIRMVKSPRSAINKLEKMGTRFKDLFCKSDKTFIRKAYKLYADTSMTYNWSVAPLPEDLKNTLNGIADYTNGIDWSHGYKKKSFTSSSTFSKPYKLADVVYHNTATTTTYMEPQSVALLNALGLDITCSQVWETLPLSFVVDMIYDVKDVFTQAYYEDRVKDLNKDVYGVCQSYKVTAMIHLYGIPYKVTQYVRHFEQSLDFSGINRESKGGILTAAKTLFDIFLR